jgi:hypothetical protein
MMVLACSFSNVLQTTQHTTKQSTPAVLYYLCWLREVNRVTYLSMLNNLRAKAGGEPVRDTPHVGLSEVLSRDEMDTLVKKEEEVKRLLEFACNCTDEALSLNFFLLDGVQPPAKREGG